MAEHYDCEDDDCYELAVAYPKEGKLQHYFCLKHYHIYGRAISQKVCIKMGLDTPAKQKAYCLKKLKTFGVKKL